VAFARGTVGGKIIMIMAALESEAHGYVRHAATPGWAFIDDTRARRRLTRGSRRSNVWGSSGSVEPAQLNQKA
jgi:hypothetical protein